MAAICAAVTPAEAMASRATASWLSQISSGIVFDPARLGVDLPELPLGHRLHAGLPVEQDRAGAGGALIQGQNVGVHRVQPPG